MDTNNTPAGTDGGGLTLLSDAVRTLLPVLGKNPRYKRAAELIALAQTGHALYRTIRTRRDRRTRAEHWTVTVAEYDDLYDVAAALVSESGERNWKAIQARSVRDLDAEEKGYRETVVALPGDSGVREFTLEGHTVRVTAEDGVLPDGQNATRREAQFVFSTTSEAGQEAVFRVLRDRLLKRYKEKPRKPALHAFGTFGFDYRSDLPVRPVESVVVTDNQVADIVADVRSFLDREDEYVRRGIPYHRGYLLYGPPGTGKTSAVKAVAHALGLDLYFVSLGSVPADTALASITAQLPPRSVLLLEDIDSFGAARKRTEDSADDTGTQVGVSTSGLLNVLDGVQTPHGQIVFLTTNHKDFLDPALLRPGRVDQSVYFGNPDDATVARHFAYFFGREPSVPLVAAGRSGAEVNEVLISHMDDPDGAERVLSAVPEREEEQA